MFRKTLIMTFILVTFLGNKIGSFNDRLYSSCQKAISKSEYDTKKLLSVLSRPKDQNREENINSLAMRLKKSFNLCSKSPENEHIMSHCSNHFIGLNPEIESLTRLPNNIRSVSLYSMIRKIERDLLLLSECIQIVESRN